MEMDASSECASPALVDGEMLTKSKQGMPLIEMLVVSAMISRVID
jgi:hypothetical protein